MKYHNTIAILIHGALTCRSTFRVSVKNTNYESAPRPLVSCRVSIRFVVKFGRPSMISQILMKLTSSLHNAEGFKRHHHSSCLSYQKWTNFKIFMVGEGRSWEGTLISKSCHINNRLYPTTVPNLTSMVLKNGWIRRPHIESAVLQLLLWMCVQNHLIKAACERNARKIPTELRKAKIPTYQHFRTARFAQINPMTSDDITHIRWAECSVADRSWVSHPKVLSSRRTVLIIWNCCWDVTDLLVTSVCTPSDIHNNIIKLCDTFRWKSWLLLFARKEAPASRVSGHYSLPQSQIQLLGVFTAMNFCRAGDQSIWTHRTQSMYPHKSINRLRRWLICLHLSTHYLPPIAAFGKPSLLAFNYCVMLDF